MSFRDTLKNIIREEVENSGLLQNSKYRISYANELNDDGTITAFLDGTTVTAFPLYPTTQGQEIMLIFGDNGKISAVPTKPNMSQVDIIHPPFFSGGSKFRFAFLESETLSDGGAGTTTQLMMIRLQDIGNSNLYRIRMQDLESWCQYVHLGAGGFRLYQLAMSPNGKYIAVAGYYDAFDPIGDNDNDTFFVRIFSVGDTLESAGTIDPVNLIFTASAATIATYTFLADPALHYFIDNITVPRIGQTGGSGGNGTETLIRPFDYLSVDNNGNARILYDSAFYKQVPTFGPLVKQTEELDMMFNSFTVKDGSWAVPSNLWSGDKVNPGDGLGPILRFQTLYPRNLVGAKFASGNNADIIAFPSGTVLLTFASTVDIYTLVRNQKNVTSFMYAPPSPPANTENLITMNGSNVIKQWIVNFTPLPFAGISPVSFDGSNGVFFDLGTTNYLYPMNATTSTAIHVSQTPIPNVSPGQVDPKAVRLLGNENSFFVVFTKT